MNTEVTVLLAAYNGANHIKQQIESIKSSECDAEIFLVIGLDPSTDETAEILGNLESESITTIKNPTPSGSAKKNFSRLVEHALTRDSNYFAFSDQDDIWDSEKIAITLHRLHEMEREHGIETPLLVFSDSRVVTEDLLVISPSFLTAESLNPDTAQDFKKLLIQNVGQGCTFLFNRALLELANPIPDTARMHDHWFMLVACAFGKIGYVNKPLLNYRQHSSNVLGSKGLTLKSAIYRAIKKSNTIKTAINQLQEQAKAFDTRYSDKLPTKTHQFLLEFGELSRLPSISRKAFCLKNRLSMGDIKRTIGLYALI